MTTPYQIVQNPEILTMNTTHLGEGCEADMYEYRMSIVKGLYCIAGNFGEVSNLAIWVKDRQIKNLANLNLMHTCL